MDDILSYNTALKTYNKVVDLQGDGTSTIASINTSLLEGLGNLELNTTLNFTEAGIAAIGAGEVCVKTNYDKIIGLNALGTSQFFVNPSFYSSYTNIYETDKLFSLGAFFINDNEFLEIVTNNSSYSGLRFGKINTLGKNIYDSTIYVFYSGAIYISNFYNQYLDYFKIYNNRNNFCLKFYDNSQYKLIFGSYDSTNKTVTYIGTTLAFTYNFKIVPASKTKNRFLYSMGTSASACAGTGVQFGQIELDNNLNYTSHSRDTLKTMFIPNGYTGYSNNYNTFTYLTEDKAVFTWHDYETSARTKTYSFVVTNTGTSAASFAYGTCMLIPIGINTNYHNIINFGENKILYYDNNYSPSFYSTVGWFNGTSYINFIGGNPPGFRYLADVKIKNGTQINDDYSFMVFTLGTQNNTPTNGISIAFGTSTTNGSSIVNITFFGGTGYTSVYPNNNQNNSNGKNILIYENIQNCRTIGYNVYSNSLIQGIAGIAKEDISLGGTGLVYVKGIVSGSSLNLAEQSLYYDYNKRHIFIGQKGNKFKSGYLTLSTNGNDIVSTFDEMIIGLKNNQFHILGK